MHFAAGLAPGDTAAPGSSPSHAAVARLLLEQGADANRVTMGGEAALHRAASVDRAEVVEALLAQGADPNLKDASGRRPIERTENARIREMLERATE